MSDEEKRLSEEEVDDLFGDDEEEEEQDSVKKSGRYGENEDEDEDEDDGEDEEEPEELKNISISLPRHAISQKPEDDTYSLKMPVFLNVEAHPFDPTEFKERVQQTAAERSTRTSLTDKQKQNELVAEKLLNENTLRWRYSNSGNDEIIKQSNSHFVQWNDGSLSLKIGNELFDVRELPLTDNFLVKTHDSYEILQHTSILNKTINLLPSSTLTSTHRKLTQAVKSIQTKDKILNTITNDDPMMKQRLADENERKTLRLRRQLESKRKLQEERLERSNSPALRGHERENAYERFARTYGEEEYDEEDDFVAGDDEEVEGYDDEDDEEEEEYERGAERLKKLKDEGASKYRDNGREEDEDEKSARKKRRIIDSDDDE
ncbi:hypothetical protein G9P44_006312 [Scheffersomyces stipitis]|nr:hypothetical protein G9P44_006312 [Scheffersomyces stipitis]